MSVFIELTSNLSLAWTNDEKKADELLSSKPVLELAQKVIDSKKTESVTQSIGDKIYRIHFTLRDSKVLICSSDITQAKFELNRYHQTLHLLDSSPAPIFLIRLEGKCNYVYVNQATEKLYGLSREEILNLSMADIDPSFFKQSLTEKMAQYRENPHSTTECSHTLPDGRVLNVIMTSTRVDLDGVEYLAGFIHDITQRMRAEQSLKENQAFLQAVLENTPSLVFVKDGAGRFVLFNKAFAQTFSLDPVADVGKSAEVLFSAAMAEKWRIEDAEILRTNKPMFSENSFNYRGSELSFLTVKFPLFHAASSSQVAVCGIALNITSHIRTQSELEAQKVNNVRSARMAALGEMASGIAHEISNPLAVISAKIYRLNSELSRRDIAKSEFQEEFASIDKTVHLISKIIQGIRLYTRDSSVDPLSQINIESILRDTVEICHFQFAKHGISFTLGEIPVSKINCVPEQVAQVLINLLNNAVDAVKDQCEKTVALTATVNAKYLDLSVIDNGMGIKPEIADKIMRPFFTTKKPGDGTGLGLSISNGIMMRHHGELKYERVGKNTVFTARFPISE